MSFNVIPARYGPPTSVYLADVKAERLARVAQDISAATRAYDARDCDGDLAKAENRLVEVLEAVRAARAELGTELDAPAPAPNLATVDDYPKSFVRVFDALPDAIRSFAPQPAPNKSAGAMGVFPNASEAAE